VAIIKTLKYTQRVPAVYEDLYPGANKIYMQTDGYTADTLNPLHDVGLLHSNIATTIADYGSSLKQDSNQLHGGYLFLGGDVTTVNQQTVPSVNDGNFALDTNPFTSMDENNPVRNHRYENNGTDTAIFTSHIGYTTGATAGGTYYQLRINPQSDASTVYPFYTNASVGGTGAYIRFVYRPPGSGNVIGCGDAHVATTYLAPYPRIANFANVFGTNPTTTLLQQSGDSTIQFVGPSVDNRALFLLNNVTNDANIQIFKFNDVSNTLVSNHFWNNTSPIFTANWISTNWNGNVFFAVMFDSSDVVTSANANVWVKGRLPFPRQWTGTTDDTANVSTNTLGGNVYVVASGTNQIAKGTANASSWTEYTIPSGGLSSQWTDIKWGLAGNTTQTLVAITNNITAATSTNYGTSWTLRTLPYTINYRSVAHGLGTFVVVGSHSNLAAAASSTDGGATWTARNLPSTGFWNSVTFGNIAGNTMFVAVQSSGLHAGAAYSKDGLTWNAANITSTATWSSVTFGAGRFVAVSGNTVADNRAAYTTNGSTWTAATLPFTANWISVNFGETATGNLFLAIAANTTSAAVSSDGVSWTATTLPTTRTGVGGLRGATFGNALPKYGSKTFTDPIKGTGYKGFYMPFVDVGGNYSPIYMQWNTADDTFYRNVNVIVDWGATSQAASWEPDTSTTSSANSNTGLNRAWYNETFVFNGTRYLTFIQVHNSGNAMDAFPLRRTFVTFSINATDPTLLTYHSKITIPLTPKNIVWLNSSRTSLGVFTVGSFYIYGFNASTGWTLTTEAPYPMIAAGYDTQGRAWGLDAGVTGFGRLHVFGGNVPATISVAFASNSFNYTGTTLSTFANVDAYDVGGNRISCNVNLTVLGTSLQFLATANAQVSTTVITTSATETTRVNAVIINGGTSTITTAVNI